MVDVDARGILARGHTVHRQAHRKRYRRIARGHAPLHDGRGAGAPTPGQPASFTYSPPEVLRKNTRLEDSAGTLYEPLDPQAVNRGHEEPAAGVAAAADQCHGADGREHGGAPVPRHQQGGRAHRRCDQGRLLHRAPERPSRSATTCRWAASCRRSSTRAAAIRSRATITSIPSPATSWCRRRPPATPKP